MSLLDKYPYIREILDELSECVDNSSYYVVAGENGSVPLKKLNNAKASMASGMGASLDSDEEILVLYDDTLFGSAKDGALITNKKIIVKPSGGWQHCQPYYKSYSISYNKGELNFGDLKLMHLHGCDKLRDGLIKLLSSMIALSNENGEVEYSISDDELRELVDILIETQVKIGDEVAGLDAFFDKYIMPYESEIEDMLRKTGSDGNIEMVIDKVIDFIPAPVRYVIPRNLVKKAVLSIKEKVFQS